MSKRIEGELGTRVDIFRPRLKDSEEDKVEGSVFDRWILLIIYNLALQASGSKACGG